MLSSTSDLVRRVRRAQRATWFPLLLLAVATFASIPVIRYSPRMTTCRAVQGAHPLGRICLVYPTASLVYWPVVLVVAYVAVAIFYMRKSRARGVGTRVRPYVVVGLAIVILATGLSVWAAHHPLTGSYNILGLHLTGQSTIAVYRLISPATTIGVALLVLARAERNVALALLAVGYLIVVLIPIGALAVPSPWYFLPHLIVEGGVLLLGAIGFALAQRSARSRSA
jgi:hypothetical protein